MHKSKNKARKKYYINLTKKEKYLNLDLNNENSNNNYNFKGKLLKNIYYDGMNPKNSQKKSTDKIENNSNNIKTPINSGKSKNKISNIKKNILELKLENNKNANNNCINLLNFCNFQFSDFDNNNLKSKTSYSFSRNYKINKNINNNEANNKIKEKPENNLSEINYSPNTFKNCYFANKYNKTIENYKYNIFLNVKKNIQNKKSTNTLNIEEISKQSIQNDKNNPIIKYISSPIKSQINNERIFSLKRQNNNILQNKKISISTNFNSNPSGKKESFLDDKIIGNLFTNKKKMFKKTEINELNNLNLLYSENISQFNKKYLNHRNKKTLKGLGLTHICSSPAIIKKNLDSKINVVKDKLSFVKSIVDFAYPEIIIRRSMKQSIDYIKKFKRNIPPYKIELMKNKYKEKFLNCYYSPILKIFHSSKTNNLKL